MAENTKNEAEVGSAFDLLGKSFEIVKKNWVAFTVVNILTILAVLFSFTENSDSKKDHSNNSFQESLNSFSGMEISAFLGFGILIALVVIAVSIYLFAMMTILEVESTEGKRPSVGHLFEKAKKYWLGLLGVMVITSLVIIVGLFFLIIPGIIAIARLVMAPYFMVDKDMGVMESIKASNEMGKKHFWKVLAAVGVMLLIAIAIVILDIIPVIGAIAGAFMSIVFSLVIVLRYQQLKKLS